MSATLAPAPVRPDVDLKAYEIVNRQFGLCILKPTFFDDFYQDFTSQSAEIKAMFAHTNMVQQKEVLRAGLTFLIMYAAGKKIAADKLDRLGESHNRRGYNIRPDQYPIWTNALVRTVKKHTPNFTVADDQAWRQVLQLGVDRIRARY